MQPQSRAADPQPSLSQQQTGAATGPSLDAQYCANVFRRELEALQSYREQKRTEDSSLADTSAVSPHGYCSSPDKNSSEELASPDASVDANDPAERAKRKKTEQNRRAQQRYRRRKRVRNLLL